MITPAKDIEYIVSLYPTPLRTLHTVFQIEIEGATSPFFLHSQVAFALLKQSKGDLRNLQNFIRICRKEE
jgi:hypothetical protein